MPKQGDGKLKITTVMNVDTLDKLRKLGTSGDTVNDIVERLIKKEKSSKKWMEIFIYRLYLGLFIIYLFKKKYKERTNHQNQTWLILFLI